MKWSASYEFPKKCEFCEDLPESLPINSNADTCRSFAVIVNVPNKKELVLSIQGTTYGVAIKYCPICGKKL